MHWFWRGVIALLSGIPVVVVLEFTVIYLANSLTRGAPSLIVRLAVGIFSLLLYSTTILCTYGILTRRYYARKGLDNETRCRNCRYILRGISEPRCSECGERI